MDAELIFWIVFDVIGLRAVIIGMRIGKKEAENYVDWVRDGEW